MRRLPKKGFIGGVFCLNPGRSCERAGMELKSSGNESTGVYLYPKKDFMKKYLFFFENESIKVENC